MGFKVKPVTMEQFNLPEATRHYNSIMMSLAYEHLTIDTYYSEGTEDWNLRDMVAECDYVLGTYYEDGHFNDMMRKDNLSQWRSDTMRLKNFIAKYLDISSNYTCASGHYSKFDN